MMSAENWGVQTPPLPPLSAENQKLTNPPPIMLEKNQKLADPPPPCQKKYFLAGKKK